MKAPVPPVSTTTSSSFVPSESKAPPPPALGHGRKRGGRCHCPVARGYVAEAAGSAWLAPAPTVAWLLRSQPARTPARARGPSAVAVLRKQACPRTSTSTTHATRLHLLLLPRSKPHGKKRTGPEPGKKTKKAFALRLGGGVPGFLCRDRVASSPARMPRAFFFIGINILLPCP